MYKAVHRHIHFHTHVSMSSTYVSLDVGLLACPPNTTALWWSIFVKVWLDSECGASPVVGGADHSSAGIAGESKSEPYAAMDHIQAGEGSITCSSIVAESAGKSHPKLHIFCVNFYATIVRMCRFARNQ